MWNEGSLVEKRRYSVYKKKKKKGKIQICLLGPIKKWPWLRAGTLPSTSPAAGRRGRESGAFRMELQWGVVMLERFTSLA